MFGGRFVRPGLLPDGAAPRVSVVIPCYNYGHYLGQAVGSALQQRDVAADVVIVDDASTDDSADVAESLARADPRVRLIRHSRNAGHVETSNEALSHATGDFVVKLDADDLLVPGALSRSARLLSAHPDVAFCYGRPLEFRGAPPQTPDREASSWTIWPGERWIGRVLHRGRNVIMQPEVMLRRSAVEASGGYRPQLRWAEDYNWWLRLATLGDVGRVNGPVQGLYRVHDGSIQRSAEDLELSDLRARIDATALYFAETTGPADALQRSAWIALLRDARRLAARARERPGNSDRAVAEFSAVAAELRNALGRSPRSGPSARPGRVGRSYRDIEARLVWQRWATWGI